VTEVPRIVQFHWNMLYPPKSERRRSRGSRTALGSGRFRAWETTWPHQFRRVGRLTHGANLARGFPQLTAVRTLKNVRHCRGWTGRDEGRANPLHLDVAVGTGRRFQFVNGLSQAIHTRVPRSWLTHLTTPGEEVSCRMIKERKIKSGRSLFQGRRASIQLVPTYGT